MEETTATAPSEVDLALAAQKVEEGKKALADKDFSTAQDALAQALEISVAKYGDLGVECGEMYYLYGTALLASAKQEAVEFFSKKVQQKLKERTGEQDDEEEEDEDLETDTDETIALAFEIFETARVIFSSQPDKKLDVAKVHVKLGKVNEEGDNLAEAISEYEQALEIRQVVLGPDHPRTVKVYATIASAHCLQMQKEEALKNYHKAISLTQQRLERLEKDKAQQVVPEGRTAEDVEQELAKLQRRLKPLEEKVEGVRHWETKQKDSEAVLEDEHKRVQAFMQSEGALDLPGPSFGQDEIGFAVARPTPPAGAAAPVVHNLGVFGRSARAQTNGGSAVKPAPAASASDEARVLSVKRKRDEAEKSDDNKENNQHSEAQAPAANQQEAVTAKKARVGGQD